MFDLDGVLSDAAGRQHFLDGSSGPKDWRAFFAASGDDPLIEDVHRLLSLLDASLTIVLLTARPTTVREQTLAWLDRYRVRWDLLVMRPERQYQPAVDVQGGDGGRAARRSASTWRSRSRTTAATWPCSVPPACRACTSTRATTNEPWVARTC